MSVALALAFSAALVSAAVPNPPAVLLRPASPFVARAPCIRASEWEWDESDEDFPDDDTINAMYAQSQPGFPPAEEEPVEKPRVTMEGIQAFRERQLLRSSGAPLSVWSKTLDRDPAEIPDCSYTPTAPTEAQKAAANTLFDKQLRDDDVPDEFGDALARFDI